MRMMKRALRAKTTNEIESAYVISENNTYETIQE